MRPVRSFLRGSPQPLTELYDVALLDLDGVVYVGPEAVPGVPEALAEVRERGMRLAFVTNNAARTPDAVADHLTELGVAAKPDEIVTSAQAAARYLADRLPGGARVLVVGTTGLEQALRERGLRPVADASGQVDAVVQGYSPDMTWRLLAEGAVAINRKVLWVATNVDPTVPSPRGPLPGNGSLVAALRHATGAEPVVTGKPDPTMHRESLLRTEARDPIVVGDRLDTDIEGANAAGCDSLLVFTGVTEPHDLLTAPPKLRPTYLGRDVSALLEAHPDVTTVDRGIGCETWWVGRPGEVWRLQSLEKEGSAEPGPPAGSGAHSDSDLDALRALCVAVWNAADSGSASGQGGTAAGRVRVEAGDESSAAVLERLGLAG